MPETLFPQVAQRMAQGLLRYEKLSRRNWKATANLGPEEECLHCSVPELEARQQAIWLAATPLGRRLVLKQFGLLIGLHCFRIAGDGTVSGNVVVAPAEWPQLFGAPKPTTLTFTPGLTNSYLLDWPQGQDEPSPPKPDTEASDLLWQHAQQTYPDVLDWLKRNGETGEATQAPEKLAEGLLYLLGPDGFHQVVAQNLGTAFELGLDNWVRPTGSLLVPTGVNETFHQSVLNG